MKKVYEAPALQPILFASAQNLAATWTDLNNGVGSNVPQEGAVASDGDIWIKL